MSARRAHSKDRHPARAPLPVPAKPLQGTALRVDFLQPPALRKHVCVYREAAVPSSQKEQQLTQQLRCASAAAQCLTLAWITCDCLQIDGNVIDFLTAASNTFKKVDQRTYMLATNDLMSFNYITLPAGGPCGRLSNALRIYSRQLRPMLQCVQRLLAAASQSFHVTSRLHAHECTCSIHAMWAVTAPRAVCLCACCRAARGRLCIRGAAADGHEGGEASTQPPGSCQGSGSSGTRCSGGWHVWCDCNPQGLQQQVHSPCWRMLWYVTWGCGLYWPGVRA